jgi:alpha-beta hydrolase superfamily lysophospholipase
VNKWKSGFIAFLAATAGVGYYFSNRLLYIKKKDDRFIVKRETEAKHFNREEYARLPKEEIWISSPFGYPLKAVLIRPYPHKKFMIFCHGVTENKISSIKYLNLFLKFGFNGVIYDHRRHGESGGKTTSYGFYEKHDLKAIVDELIKREGEDVFFGIHGESMGAATALLYAGMLEDRADFYIADCPFSDFRAQIIRQMKQELGFAPKLLVQLAEWSVLWRGGFSVKSISPLAAVSAIRHPVLFIHSIEDDFILPDMSKELFERKKGPKQLYLAKKGAHARSYLENPAEYENAVRKFLRELVGLPL